MKRVVFLPDRPVDRPGDLFRALVRDLGLGPCEVEANPEGADFVAFVGRRRAELHFGRPVKTGPAGRGFGGAEVYVLPSTAPEMRRHFYEGQWRSFAARVLGRDLAVRDEYKGMAPEAIKAALDAKRFPFAVLCANVAYDFNLGSIIRTANAFLAREVVLFGRRKADLRGAMGSHVYETIRHAPDLPSLACLVAERGYVPVCFEQGAGAVPLPEFSWPPEPLLMFGQEGPGVPDDLRAFAKHRVFIPQFGSIRSLNVGVAAGIAMYALHTSGTLSR